VLATVTVAASVLTSRLPTVELLLQQNLLLLLLALISVILGILSFYYAVRTLLPASDVRTTDIGSVIFFGEIARSYAAPDDYETAVDQFFGDDAQVKTQVSRQVWAVSRIAARKYRFVNRSILLFTIAVFLGLVAVTGSLLAG
jgi:hypothetical protein